MKRCPDCQFIYEDEQPLCDMDGQALVNEQTLITRLDILLPARKHRKSILIPALTGLVLAGVLSLTYYAAINSVRSKTVASTPRGNKSQKFDINVKVPNPEVSFLATGSASAIQPETTIEPEETSIPATSPLPVTEASARAHVSKSDRRLYIPRDVPALPRLRPLPTLADAQPKYSGSSANRSASRSEKARQQNAQKKDSKFNSLLKKTGRVLQKPFKF